MITRICTAATASTAIIIGYKILRITRPTLIGNWNFRNFITLCMNVLPRRTASVIDTKLSSVIIMSPASLHTSVPDPIEKPTSAAFKAGASFVPSPVIPTQSPSSCANRTILSFVLGVALAITLICGNFSFASSSDNASKSIADIAISVSSLISPASFAIAFAVSMTSPVTIIT